MNERKIENIKKEISSIDITKTPGRNIATFNHNAARLWQLCNQFSNPIDELFLKVKYGYQQCAVVPTWLNFIDSLNILTLSFDAYLVKAENKYREHLDHGSWTYKLTDSVIPKKPRPEASDDTIAMPAIQQPKANAANKLSPHAFEVRGSKRLPTGVVKKKNKLVKFQQKSAPPPSFTDEHWQKIITGNCPTHGKSEDGYTISGKNWYW